MTSIRVLHLASFEGNVGDKLNHEGFYKGISQFSDKNYIIDQLEIRDFYRKKRQFDRSLLQKINVYDLFVVGGGNYFELWIENSPTGTSFAMPLDIFQEIQPPVVFNALGVDPAQGATSEHIEKFKNFLDVAIAKKTVFLSVRNDGSIGTLTSLLGKKYTDHFVWTPDAGFNASFKAVETHSKTLAVNLAGDMLDLRFGETAAFDNFLAEFCALISALVKKSIVDRVVLVPHIFRDLDVISRVMNLLPDDIVRERLVVGELGVGKDISRFKGYYSACSAVLGMRFHSNIAGIAASKPTIGLGCYRQIFKLYEELESPDMVVDVRVAGFSRKLEELIIKHVGNDDNESDLSSPIRNKQIQLYASYMQTLSHFLRKSLR